jgi:hypothetical protein
MVFGRFMKHSGYLSYLLRLWKVRQGENITWQASLDNPHTGERKGFANLETLVAFLEERMSETNCQEKDDHKSESESP